MEGFYIYNEIQEKEDNIMKCLYDSSISYTEISETTSYPETNLNEKKNKKKKKIPYNYNTYTIKSNENEYYNYHYL